MQAWRARTLAETGRWSEADDDARAVLAAPHAAPVSRMAAASALALVAVRRGDAAAGKLLADAQAVAATSAEGQRRVPVLAVTAESAYLAGRLEDAGAAAREGLRYVSADRPSLDRDRLSYWLWKAGAMDEAGRDNVAHGAMGPFAMMICGRWPEAAAAWQDRGCPYERGLALLEGDAPAVQAALEIFLTLGAEPAANWARQRLRQIGVTHAPRGRRPATRAHPAGLTRREVEVLEKLAEGLSNPDIARRLFVSPKTVDHHVSAILAKLDVASRDAAVTIARERGWLSPR
jgi:DNA-binding CsgD family transcriptional regulator